MIYSKFRNTSGPQNPDAPLRIALEGPKEGAAVVSIEAVALWENSAKIQVFIF